MKIDITILDKNKREIIDGDWIKVKDTPGFGMLGCGKTYSWKGQVRWDSKNMRYGVWYQHTPEQIMSQIGSCSQGLTETEYVDVFVGGTNHNVNKV